MPSWASEKARAHYRRHYWFGLPELEAVIRETIEECARQVEQADDDYCNCPTCASGVCSAHQPAEGRIRAMLEEDPTP